MKLLTFAIPCYNSAEYMDKAIRSILPGGEDVEILIVDDGSTDRTAEIADAYEKEYPGICRAIHKENGGHGSAINAGISEARGIYFKVVDSDDWVSGRAYAKILQTLKRLVSEGTMPDMLVANYVYEKQGEGRKVMRCSFLPENRIINWQDMGPLLPWQYILMHSLIYRTEMLRASGFKLLEHTFYVDNIFAFEPLPDVKTLYYLNVNFYRYFIGRADQSVNEKVMLTRYDQQLRVNKRMVDYLCENKKRIKKKSKKLWNYMVHYLIIVTAISATIAVFSGTQEDLKKREKFWAYVREQDREVFLKLRYSIVGAFMNLPGKTGRMVSFSGYKVTQKLFKFN